MWCIGIEGRSNKKNFLAQVYLYFSYDYKIDHHCLVSLVPWLKSCTLVYVTEK